jgi:hypothetical protein
MTNDLKKTFEECEEIDAINTKRSIQPELLKSYINTYNFLQERIQNEELVPKKTENELIANWMSNRNWLTMPVRGYPNREAARNSDYPNIYITIYEDLEWLEAGIHWAQTKSVDNFLNLLDSLNSTFLDQLKEVFSKLKKKYTIITQNKIHAKGLAPAAPADFTEIKLWALNDFGSNTAEEILKSAEEIRIEGQRMREFGEVEWAVPTIQIQHEQIKANDYEQLLDIIMDYMSIMDICQKMLGQTEIKKIRKNLEKEFDYEKLKKQYDKLHFLLTIKKITKEHFDTKVEELNNIIKQYNLAFNKDIELLK